MTPLIPSRVNAYSYFLLTCFTNLIIEHIADSKFPSSLIISCYMYLFQSVPPHSFQPNQELTTQIVVE